MTQQNVATLPEKLIDRVATVVLGKPKAIKLAICCFLARGHLLIEDRPGVGKTTLARSMARVLGVSFQRLQFTSDLLPSDVIGVSILNSNKQQFEFHPGPLFTEFLLADEINRATPKTQSALLEAMAERRVTVDGQTHELSRLFFVVATQNPTDLTGAFPLPESQLDRFLMRITLDYPPPEAERAMLEGHNPAEQVDALQAICTEETSLQLREMVANVHASAPVLDYLQRLVEASRTHPGIEIGLSPRAALALLSCARAWALMEQRQHLLPDDIRAVFSSVANHRLRPRDQGSSGWELAHELLDSVSVEAPSGQ
jgi:MoxR-like ATPase